MKQYKLSNECFKYFNSLENSLQNGGTHGLFTITSHQPPTTFQGAGVILLNDYNNKATGVTTPCFIVYKSKDNTYAELPGGRYDVTHKNLIDTAYNELLEESRFSLEIGKHILKHCEDTNLYIDIDGRPPFSGHARELVRFYACKLKGISSIHYIKNKLAMDALEFTNPNSIHKRYLETDEIIRIPITEIQAVIGGGKKNILDISGKPITISNQTYRILTAYCQLGMHARVNELRLPHGNSHNIRSQNVGKGKFLNFEIQVYN